MRKILAVLLVCLLVFILMADVKITAAQEETPVVHAVLFWTRGCSFCEQTLTTILPALQDKYQAQLSIRAIELAGSEDIDRLYAIGGSLGLSKEQVGVPFLIIDRTALVGVGEIQTKLPGLIDSYLAAGGVSYPDLPGLNEWLQKGDDYATSAAYLQETTPTASQVNPTGMTLAWVIMVVIWLALIFAIVMILRAFQGKVLRSLKDWAEFVIPILCVIGLGASIYLTYVEITHTRALCGPVGDCNSVQSSPYARLFGFLPVALLGAAGYIAILVAWLWGRLRREALTRIAGPAMFGMALFGTLFSIYLTYLELFVIHAVCIWCLSSAVIITALMLLSLPPITQWLAISDEEE